MKKLNVKPRQVVKAVATTVVAVGASVVVKQVIKQNLPEEFETFYVKNAVKVGMWVIPAVMSLHAHDYVGDKIDGAFDALTSSKELIEQQIQEAKEV